ncbi:bifunctional polysaccharide deacetylase/glycosyltransferase family 2 protein [Plantactinospora endophytica]|uniref:bifunctional polysaccharide deacetylase/glycosyltransferase family 2 protein n=1 Tax=Plantactinospora endophytica TaxID=673535 RepID=UPI001EF17421|nr:bifunctional polysaccharide deacetylase/glycosyltransferase family 2 protein [Plantactinospora endophytica]
MTGGTGPESNRPRNHRPARNRRVVPRPRWTAGLLLAAAFAGILLFEAFVNAEFVPDHEATDAPQAIVPAEIVSGGPIIYASPERTGSYRLPPKTIALTFDDGPDPRWTPEVVAALREYDVPATFFVVGSAVARHQSLTRQLVAEGHELGVHTFTHPDLGTISGQSRRLQYAQTQLAIAYATGVHTSLLRFPYSSKPEAIDDHDWPLIQEAGRLGYLTVVNDTDSQDWARPGVDKIVANMTPTGDDGAVVLLHDAGGERSQTVAALRRFIPAMQARGYRFTTVSEGLALTLGGAGTPGGADPRAGAGTALTTSQPLSAGDRWRGGFLVWTVRIADGTLSLLWVAFVVVGVLAVVRTVLLFVLAGRHARRRRSPDWAWGPPVTEPVSVIVPAYNERAGIVPAVRSLATGDHPTIEVIVVDDGSTDGTADLVEELRLPNVRVVRKPNGGKSSALNAGIAFASHQLIVMVDGDTVFEPDSIRLLVQPFGDPGVGAVAGNVKVGNRGSLVARWQHIEYVIGFNLDRRLYETLRCMPTVPGAIGAFRRQAVVGAGGMTDDTLAEDTDITMAIVRAGWKVVYEERARAWTEAPATLGQLWKQRYRWSYGTMQAMWKHRRALADHGASGRFGRRGLPFLALFGIALPLLAPVIDIMAVYGLLFADQAGTVLAWLGMLGLQAVTGVVAFRLDRERLRPLWALPLQQFGYRQLMYLVLIQSVVTALSGGRLRWQKLHRTGQDLVPGQR